MPSSASLLLHPPLSTPFLYTTLFRSEKRRLPGAVRTDQPRHLARTGFEIDVGQRAIATELDRHLLGDEQAAVHHARSLSPARSRPTPDRKSTRLNSSHTVISYAVFCFTATPSPSIHTLSLHDALPI